jgi:hypothetical protein
VIVRPGRSTTGRATISTTTAAHKMPTAAAVVMALSADGS